MVASALEPRQPSHAVNEPVVQTLMVSFAMVVCDELRYRPRMDSAIRLLEFPAVVPSRGNGDGRPRELVLVTVVRCRAIWDEFRNWAGLG